MRTHVDRHCPIPIKGGSDCWDPTHPDAPMGLCERHWRIIGMDWQRGWPHMKLICRFCKHKGMILVPSDGIAYCPNRECARVIYDLEMDHVPNLRDEAQRRGMATGKAREVLAVASVVYYIRWADRVKIGTSTSLPTRMKAIYHDELLAVEEGGTTLEAQRHKEFDRFKLAQYKEWFQLTPELVAHINELRKGNGPPMTYWRKLTGQAA